MRERIRFNLITVQTLNTFKKYQNRHWFRKRCHHSVKINYYSAVIHEYYFEYIFLFRNIFKTFPFFTKENFLSRERTSHRVRGTNIRIRIHTWPVLVPNDTCLAVNDLVGHSTPVTWCMHWRWKWGVCLTFDNYEVHWGHSVSRLPGYRLDLFQFYSGFEVPPEDGLRAGILVKLCIARLQFLLTVT